MSFTTGGGEEMGARDGGGVTGGVVDFFSPVPINFPKIFPILRLGRAQKPDVLLK